MSDPERFIVESGECRLAARSYAPAADAFPGAAFVFLHGLLSSADVFDVPGLEALSLPRQLQVAGVRVVSYDQRGAGDSTTDDWAFGLHEHATIDLPAVLAACRERFGIERVILASHSLGGTIWLRYLQARIARGDWAGQPAVVGGVSIASPADFDRSYPPWSDIARRGRGFVESIDHDGNQIVTRDEFVGAQVTLYWPWAGPFFRPAGVRLGLAVGASSVFGAAIMRRLPVPTLIHHRDDFSSAEFQRVLQSKTLDRGPIQLLLELADQVIDGPGSAGTPVAGPIDLPVICFGSTLDRLVPLRTVQSFASRFRNAKVMATEADYGVPSGHVGYFFKRGLRERVAREVIGWGTGLLSTAR